MVKTLSSVKVWVVMSAGWEAAVPSGDSKVDEDAVTLQMLLRGFEGLLWPETQTPACLLDASF